MGSKPQAFENITVGAITGGIAAFVGAIIWAIITILTKFQIGFMAVGVGYLVGVTMRKFGNGYSNAFGVLAAILALVGCALGNLLSACAFASHAMHVPLLAVLAKLDPISAWEILQDSFAPLDILFYFLAVSAAYRTSTAA